MHTCNQLSTYTLVTFHKFGTGYIKYKVYLYIDESGSIWSKHCKITEEITSLCSDICGYCFILLIYFIYSKQTSFINIYTPF